MKELIILSYLLGIQVVNVINFQNKETQIKKEVVEARRRGNLSCPIKVRIAVSLLQIPYGTCQIYLLVAYTSRAISCFNTYAYIYIYTPKLILQLYIENHIYICICKCIYVKSYVYICEY